jgi:hypothetical protein
MLQVPRTPYIKSIDVWCGGCVLFVFATLMEYTLAYQAATKANDLEKRRRKQLASYKVEDFTGNEVR